MFGSAGVPTRAAGYIRDGSRADSGIPPAISRQLHSLTELTVLYSNGPDDKSVELVLGYVTTATSEC
jgi:hypothetical protein